MILSNSKHLMSRSTNFEFVVVSELLTLRRALIGMNECPFDCLNGSNRLRTILNGSQFERNWWLIFQRHGVGMDGRQS